MRLFIDPRAAGMFTPTTQDGGRHYYVAESPFLAILRCDDMDLTAARGRVVDAEIAGNPGTPGFVQEGNVGLYHTRITIRQVLGVSGEYSKSLIEVLQDAPRETQKDPAEKTPPGN